MQPCCLEVASNIDLFCEERSGLQAGKIMTGFFDKEFGLGNKSRSEEFHYQSSNRDNENHRLVGAFLSRNVVKVSRKFVSAVVLHSDFTNTTKSKIEYAEFCAIAEELGCRISDGLFFEGVTMKWR